MKKKLIAACFLHIPQLLILLTIFTCTQPADTDNPDNNNKYIIEGNIEKTVTSFSRVEAVINGDNGIDNFPKIEELWFNASTNDFSGYFYLSKTSEVNNYSVYVNVYNVDSVFTGRSETVHFNSLASIIKISTIDPMNAFPSVFAGNDTALSILDYIFLHAVAVDSFGGTIEKWEWDIGNTGTLYTTASGDTLVFLPEFPDSNYTCIVRVTDNDGHSDIDTISIAVLFDAPVPTASTTTPIVSINDTILFQGTATDSFGEIVKWEWDVGNTGDFVETTPDSNITAVAPATANTNYLSRLRVMDDDGIVASDLVGIKVLQDAPVPTASTTTPEVYLNDTIMLFGTATDEYGRIVKWEWDAGNTGTFVETTPDSNYISLAPGTTDSNYLCLLRVTDDDNNVALDTVIIIVSLFSTQKIITTDAKGAYDVYAIDLDKDADIDVLSASAIDRKIAWYENDGAENFTTHTITMAADGAYSVFAIDVDGDTDIDVLSASVNDDKIAWYENDGAQNFTTHTITTSADGSRSVFAIDVDGDTDIDVLSASSWDNKVAWYENDGNQQFTEHPISTAADGAIDVFAIDIDGDGDIDVLSASLDDDKIAWYDNDGSENFTAYTITSSADGARSVYAIDVDGDTDIDILSASGWDDRVAWFENDGNQQFTEHPISTTADAPSSVFAIDLDGDADIDVVSASYNDSKIAWYENDGAEVFTEYKISGSAYGAYSVFAIDVNGDGHIDILSASNRDNKIAWYRNF